MAQARGPRVLRPHQQRPPPRAHMRKLHRARRHLVRVRVSIRVGVRVRARVRVRVRVSTCASSTALVATSIG